MNVQELEKLLSQYPSDMEIITTCCSDYDLVTEDDFTTVKAVNKGFYIMREHHSMSEENKSKEKTYLHISGN